MTHEVTWAIVPMNGQYVVGYAHEGITHMAILTAVDGSYTVWLFCVGPCEYAVEGITKTAVNCLGCIAETP